MTEVQVNRSSTGSWLLAIQNLAVAIYVGGLSAVVFIWLTSNFASLDFPDPRRKMLLDQVGHLMVFLVVPGLLVAIVVGALLLRQRPRHFLRMRWLQVNLFALAFLIPAAHLFCRSRMLKLREVADEVTNASLASQFGLGLGLSLVGSIAVMVLARLKPGWGQKTEH